MKNSFCYQKLNQLMNSFAMCDDLIIDDHSPFSVISLFLSGRGRDEKPEDWPTPRWRENSQSIHRIYIEGTNQNSFNSCRYILHGLNSFKNIMTPRSKKMKSISITYMMFCMPGYDSVQVIYILLYTFIMANIISIFKRNVHTPMFLCLSWGWGQI